MFIPVREEKKPWILPTPGLQLATLYMLADLGTQESSWNGQVKRARCIMMGWELAEEFGHDSRPLGVYEDYKLVSGDKAKITIHLTSWLGINPATVELKSLLGQPANIMIENKVVGEKRYANVKMISPKKRTEIAPPMVNEKIYFDLNHYDAETFSRIPGFIQKKIMRSPEWIKADAATPKMSDFTGRDDFSDTPF